MDFLLPAKANWLAPFKNELLAFPNGKYDDQVDSMVQFLDWLGSKHGSVWVEKQLNGGRRRRHPSVSRQRRRRA